MDVQLQSQLELMLDSVTKAVQAVIPQPQNIGQVSNEVSTIIQPEMGVLVSVTGALKGRLVVESTVKTFSGISMQMYGMELEGEMLESFVGEIGNMIGGTLCTNISSSGLLLDITPPTVLVGQTKITGLGQGFCLPIELGQSNELRVHLMLTEN